MNHVQYIPSNFNCSSLNTPIYNEAAFYPTEKGAEGEGMGYPETTHTDMVKNPISRQKLVERPTVILVVKGV